MSCWLMIFCLVNFDVRLCVKEPIKMMNQAFVLNNPCGLLDAIYSFDVDF